MIKLFCKHEYVQIDSILLCDPLDTPVVPLGYMHQCKKCGKKKIMYSRTREKDMGNVSDGYHTFNELYHHRAVLFSAICKCFPHRAWKSLKHYDGTMYDGYFIIGIKTPRGQATYHFKTDEYWELFNVRILDNAPEWDGHTPAEAIERIKSLNEEK